ncbi:MAG: hypothetical protein ACP5Q4_08050 [Candidatus Caldatribacteriaceae bacterium]
MTEYPPQGKSRANFLLSHARPLQCSTGMRSGIPERRHNARCVSHPP